MMRELGADQVINYKQEPEWGAKAKALTGGRGVDHVIEIGGAGTMPQSIHACRMGGHIAHLGVLAVLSGEVPTYAIFKSQLKISGVMVGSRAHQEDMIRALNATGMKPIIDSSYELVAIADAFRHQQSQTHFGKICLTI